MKISFVFLFLILFFVFCAFIFSFVSLQFLFNILNIVKLKCGDDIYKELLKEIKNKIDRNFLFTLFVFVINFIEIILIIYEIYYNCKNRDLEAEKKSLEENFNSDNNENENDTKNKNDKNYKIRPVDYFTKYEKNEHDPIIFSNKNKFTVNNNYINNFDNDNNYNNDYNNLNNEDNNNENLNLNERRETKKISKSNDFNDIYNNRYGNQNINNNDNNNFNNNKNNLSYSTSYVGTEKNKNDE
jgi:hypothetical protein